MKSKLIYVFLFIFLITCVIAQPPTVQFGEPAESLNIIYVKNHEFPKGSGIDLHFHVFNSSGSIMTSTTLNFCTIHIYNGTNSHLTQQNLTYTGTEWEIQLDSTYTNMIGAYPYIVWCDGEQDGYLSTEYFVSQDGVTYDGRGNMNLSVSLLLIFILSSYLIMAFNWDFTLFNIKESNKNNAIKGMLIWLFIWLMPSMIQFTVEIAEGFGATFDMITLINVLYQVSIWIAVVISIYFAVFFVYNVLLYLGKKGGEMQK